MGVLFPISTCSTSTIHSQFNTASYSLNYLSFHTTNHSSFITISPTTTTTVITTITTIATTITTITITITTIATITTTIIIIIIIEPFIEQYLVTV